MGRALSMILAVLLLATPAFGRKQDKEAADAPFSAQTVERLMAAIEDGLIAQNPRKLLSAFDPQMPGYAELRDRIETMLREYESFRVNHNVQDVTTEGNRGLALVDFQMEAVPRNEISAPVRNAAQLRLECLRTNRGWKIAGFQPKNFFISMSE